MANSTLLNTHEFINETNLSPRHLAWNRFLHHKGAVVSFIIIICFFILSFSAPIFEYFFDINANAVNLFDRFQPSTSKHLFGTDELGRDVFSRLLYGGQISLLVGLITALVAALIGTFVGLISGYYGGRVDQILMRFTDSIIALPLLPLLIILAAVDLNKLGLPETITHSEYLSLYRIIFIIALFGWTTVARLVRAKTLSVKQQDYIKAAYSLGVHPKHIIFRHVLPNVIGPIIVATSLSIGNIILLESVLSFLGLGIQPPVASWGNMLTNAQDLIWDQPLLTFYPGIMIFVVVISFNFLGDGLQDALNPKTLKK